MKKALITAIGLLLACLGSGSRADAPLIYCVGTESGGDGPRRYAYEVDSASFPMVEFRVGTNDLNSDAYMDLLVPIGWNIAIEAVPMCHAHGVKTPHGQVSPGPCYCMTSGSVHWWTDDPAFAVEYFTFGYNHPWSSEDIGWTLITRREGPPPEYYTMHENWDSPVGTGYGPLHGPSSAAGGPSLECDVTWGNCLTGEYGFTFSVHGNDGQQLSFFADVTWTGVSGAEVQTDDCYVFEPWASNAMQIDQGENYYHIAAGTGPNSQYEDLDLAYIVAEGPGGEGKVHFTGVISRLGIDYDVGAHVPLPLGGDANLDGRVDGADYTLWADHYGCQAGWQGGDFNGSGLATGADYTIWADNHGAGCDAISVPEPAALAMLILGGAGLIRGRRRI